MGVLEHHQERLPARKCLHLEQQRLENAVLLLLRRQRGDHGVGGQPQQIGKQRPIAACDQRGQLIGLVRCRIAARETGSALKLADDREERTVPMMWRAKIAQPHMRLAAKTLGERLGKARLADPWLGRDQYDPAVALARLTPAAQQQVEFFLATDEWRFARAQRLEAAGDAALAEHLPHLSGAGKALKVLPAEIAHLEQAADMPARRVRDDDRIGSGQTLQPSGEIWGLTNDRLLPRRTGAEQVADHDQAGRDAEPHLEPLRQV